MGTIMINRFSGIPRLVSSILLYFYIISYKFRYTTDTGGGTETDIGMIGMIAKII